MIRAASFSALLLVVPPVAIAQENPPAQTEDTQAMVVTSDTDAYCETLIRQIDRHAGTLPAPAESLRAQGTHLCAIGQVRGGINRLRRALLVLNEPDDAGAAQGEDIQQ